MKLSKKYKTKLKKELLATLESVAIVTATLAIIKLTGISMPNDIEKLITQSKNRLFADAETESNEIENLSDCADLNGIRINGQEYIFAKNKYSYDIKLPYNIEDELQIEYIKIDEGQNIIGDSNYILQSNSKIINFDVISKNKIVKNKYTINLEKEHSTYLKNIAINSFAINPEFSEKTLDYIVNIVENTNSLKVHAIPYDKESIVTIQGNESVSENSIITIKVTNPNIEEERIYTITCKKTVDVNNYNYSGGYQEFIAPYSGMYRFECWGARGGKSRIDGSLGGTPGKGGYAKGEILLKKGEKYYVYVGQQGIDAVVKKDSAATWNGGGLGTWDYSDNETSGSGGGATDIRLISGNWNETKSLASRIIVAGGGGGASWTYRAGSGGGISGENGTRAKSGTQISGYAFGIGQNASGIADSDGVGGGRRWLLGRTYEQYI